MQGKQDITPGCRLLEVQLQRLVIFGDRLIEQPEVFQGIAQIVASFGIRRPDRECLFVMRNRLFDLPKRLKRAAEAAYTPVFLPAVSKRLDSTRS